MHVLSMALTEVRSSFVLLASYLSSDHTKALNVNTKSNTRPTANTHTKISKVNMTHSFSCMARFAKVGTSKGLNCSAN